MSQAALQGLLSQLPLGRSFVVGLVNLMPMALGGGKKYHASPTVSLQLSQMLMHSSRGASLPALQASACARTGHSRCSETQMDDSQGLFVVRV